MNEFEASGVHGQAPLVSVIVPFYNVEAYVEGCLRSLTAQDFERYEVICIDDGSTDGTGKLLDRFAEQYPFVRVFHFENAGLSVARNRGVALARGRLVTFVDGDDCVSPRYVRVLYEAHGDVPGRMVKAGYVPIVESEQAMCGHVDCFGGSDCLAGLQVVKGANEVRRMLLLGRFEHYAWGALAERGLYEQVPFEPGVLFEDIYASADLVGRLSELVLLNAKLYGYTQRKGSICNPGKHDERLLRDNLAAIRHFRATTESWDEGLRELVPVKVARLYSALCSRALLLGERAERGTCLSEARRFVWESRGVLLRAVREGWLSAREVSSLALKATFPQAWLGLRRVRGWAKGRRR